MSAISSISRHKEYKNLTKLIYLYELKGKSVKFKDLFTSSYNKILETSLKNDLIALNEFFSLNIKPSRLKLLLKSDFIPQNKSETILSNIKYIINKINISNSQVRYDIDEIIGLVKSFRRGTNAKVVGKTNKNDIYLFAKGDNITIVKGFLESFNYHRTSKKFEYLALVTELFIDFSLTNFFANENNHESLIILYYLIATYFDALKYVSFFTILLKNKERLAHSLTKAKFGYQDDLSESNDLYNLLIDVLISCYDEIYHESHKFDFEKTLKKADFIEGIILNELPSVFSKEDIVRIYPNVSNITIERTLKSLKEQNQIQVLSKGRSAKWQKNFTFEDNKLTLF